MFAGPNDIAMSGSQQMGYQNNQTQSPHQQRMQPYGGYQQPQHQHHPQQQQQQQQQQYLAYQNSGKNAAMNSMPFQTYMPSQQMFQYGYAPQQAANNQYAQPAPQPQMAPQQQQQQQQAPQQPQSRQMSFSQQGGNNSMNQYMGGGYGRGQGGNFRGGRGRGGMHPGGYGNFHRQVHNNYYYNQHHHYNTNNAVPEKTATVHLMNPETKRIISIKLNRVYSTMADIRSQLKQHKSETQSSSNNASVSEEAKNEQSTDKIETALTPKFDPKTTKLVLCLSFLSPQGCIHGSGCDKVHVAGLEYAWSQVEATEVDKDGQKAYAAGFHIHCYDPTLSRYYKVPSESVYVTVGSTHYVSMYNDHGDNFKIKFKLCSSVIDDTTCEKGIDCEDIHCVAKDLEAVKESSANATHVNNAEAMDDVLRLPADMTVRVYNQNSFDVYRDYPGSNVLITEGAKAYQKQFEQEMNNIPSRKRMQHCAHFRLKDMCRLGETCRFLHVLPTEQEIKEREEAAAAAVASAQEEGEPQS